ncbi:outer dense fiber protein 2 [Thrips palmi]|uniref:Outer dense fiber protein 2 n=1 Tax=Thrips palmi TaxID=161013 RepID=A0A6P9A8L7_THRPL|nr:outer dense fiber protein 2 [Thrips palmi]
MSVEKEKARRHRAVPAKKSARSDEEHSQRSQESQQKQSQHSQHSQHSDQADTKGIENELAKMETELGVMQQELLQVQREREVLGSHRRALKAAAPAVPVPLSESANLLTAPSAEPLSEPLAGPLADMNHAAAGAVRAGSGPAPQCTPEQRGSLGWRHEPVTRLREALEAKALENCQLRGQVERLQEALEGWQKRAMELKCEKNKVHACENSRHAMVGSRETALERQQMVQQMTLQYSEAQEELQEMRTLIEDQAGHLEGYRNKYLMARQQAEEQKRLIEQMETEHDRIADQVLAELHRAKAEFEAQLQELAPLPDILAATQAKMQEERQMRVAAEHGSAELSHQLAAALERLEDAEKAANDLRAQQQSWTDERQSLVSHVDANGRKCAKLRDDVAWYKHHMEQLEQLHEDTVLDLARVRAELEASKDQATRQAARLREQADTMQRSFRKQIGVLEQELAESRASAATAHKEKEEFQQRLQTEVSNMKQSFGQTQDRIKNLQMVVDVLQNNVLNVNMDKAPAEALAQI